MRVEVAGVRARVHARLRKITPKACVRARADSPLVRLLLSMYIAQHSTNPVIKEDVGVGRERLSGPRHAEETGSHTLTHDAHTQEGGPEPNGTVRTLSDRTDRQTVQHQ